MELMTSWEEKGLQIGLQQGMQRERDLILRQLERRVGTLSNRVQASLKRLSVEQIESLGEALLDFANTHDLARWLREHAASNGKPNGQQPKNKRRKTARQPA